MKEIVSFFNIYFFSHKSEIFLILISTEVLFIICDGMVYKLILTMFRFKQIVWGSELFVFRHVAKGGCPQLFFCSRHFHKYTYINLNYKGVGPPHIFGEHIRDGRENKEIKKLKVKELCTCLPTPFKKIIMLCAWTYFMNISMITWNTKILPEWW